MKLFMFAASLQKVSLNKKLIQIAHDQVVRLGHEVDLGDFSEFSADLYNADIQNGTGIPKVITDFVTRMHQADGLIISSPEYNFSIPGTLKNLIDWVSRIKPMPWKNQRLFLMSASPALVGGNRGLWATRVPLESCGALIYPDMFSLASAHEAFDDQNQLKNSQSNQMLNDMLAGYLDMLARLK